MYNTFGRQIKYMLKRKFYDSLLKWKKGENKKALLVKGARQVGKTYIIHEFGTKEYESLIEINFIRSPFMKEIFSADLSAEKIYSNLTLYNPEYKLIEGSTLLFLDEIQECPNARAALKFLTMDGRYDVIASGSLLGLSYKDVPSIPVGYETQMTMYPLDLEEYLWAKGYDAEQINTIGSYCISMTKMPEVLNSRMEELVREYMVVGGMPEAVQTYVDTANFIKVDEIQHQILDSYHDDVSRYADAPDKPKITKCYESIPAQLAKINKKFQFSVVEKGSSSRKFGGSVDWLKDAGMIYICRNVSSPSYPLAAYEDPNFYKVYAADIGLLIAMYGYEMKAAVINNTISGPAKGGIYENFTACQLASKGISLRYFKASNGDIEVEFLTEENGAVVPIEVKAKNGTSTSIKSLLNREDIPKGYKFIFGNIGQAGKMLSLPHCMTMFLPIVPKDSIKTNP